MTPATSPVLGGIEQILLVLFILMIFISITGGNPSTVLKPFFDIVAQIAMALLSLLCALLTTVLHVGLSLLVSSGQTLAGSIQSGPDRKLKR